MNGIHDMGGMHGMRPLRIEENEPVFHADWEKRVFAMCFATFGNYFPVDETRHAIERIDPATYLQSSYYERWLLGLEILLFEYQLISSEELADRMSQLAKEAKEAMA